MKTSTVNIIEENGGDILGPTAFQETVADKIVIVINGGCLSGVYAKDKKTVVELIDVDNLQDRDSEGGGLTGDQVDEAIAKATKGLAAIF